MSYTNTKLVKSYLTDSFPRQDKISDQALAISGVDFISFFSGTIDEDDFKVKSIQSNDLSRTTITIGASTTSISSSPLVPSTVVVASDSSLGTIYTENIDYIIDYQNGNLILKDGGSLSIGLSITIWFQAFVVYLTTTDYLVDYDKGDIKRVASGNIADGETVLLDYVPISSSYNDVIISNSVIMANGLIDKEIDQSGDFGADPLLQASATFKALEIICQTSAVRQLSQLKGQDRASSGWLKLSEMFSDKSSELLNKFRPPFDNYKSPDHT